MHAARPELAALPALQADLVERSATALAGGALALASSVPWEKDEKARARTRAAVKELVGEATALDDKAEPKLRAALDRLKLRDRSSAIDAWADLALAANRCENRDLMTRIEEVRRDLTGLVF